MALEGLRHALARRRGERPVWGSEWESSWVALAFGAVVERGPALARQSWSRGGFKGFSLRVGMISAILSSEFTV